MNPKETEQVVEEGLCPGCGEMTSGPEHWPDWFKEDATPQDKETQHVD